MEAVAQVALTVAQVRVEETTVAASKEDPLAVPIAIQTEIAPHAPLDITSRSDHRAWCVLMESIKIRARRHQRSASFVLLVLRLLQLRQHAPSALAVSTRIRTLRQRLKWRGKILRWVRLTLGEASPHRPME